MNSYESSTRMAGYTVTSYDRMAVSHVNAMTQTKAAVRAIQQQSHKGDGSRPNAYYMRSVRGRYTSIVGSFNSVVPLQPMGSFGKIVSVRAIFAEPADPNFDALRRTTFSSATYNQALERLNAKVRGNVDLSIDAFEHKSTRRMFKLLSVAREVIEDARRALRGRPKLRYSRRHLSKEEIYWLQRFSNLHRTRAVGSAGVVSNVYLQIKYGWIPFLKTLDEVILRTLDPGFFTQVMKFKGRAEEKGTFNEQPYEVTMPGTSSSDNAKVRVSCMGTRFSMCEIAVLVDVSKASSKVAAWTSLNPLSIAYEMTSLSFVADYFYNLSSYLRGVETALAYNNVLAGGYVTRTYGMASSTAVTAAPLRYTGLPRSLSAVGDGSVKMSDVSRTLLTSWPFPTAPSLNFKLGSSQCSTLAALATQAFRNMRPTLQSDLRP